MVVCFHSRATSIRKRDFTCQVLVTSAACLALEKRTATTNSLATTVRRMSHVSSSMSKETRVCQVAVQSKRRATTTWMRRTTTVLVNSLRAKCTDATWRAACNYDEDATVNDGSCDFATCQQRHQWLHQPIGMQLMAMQQSTTAAVTSRAVPTWVALTSLRATTMRTL